MFTLREIEREGLMNFLNVTKDGGPESKVWAHWLIEVKGLFSVVLLRFEDGSREAFHSHAFNSISWVLRGTLIEEHLNGTTELHIEGWKPIKTLRSTFHRVTSIGRSWVLSFRGPWADKWEEYLPHDDMTVSLTHGRREL